MKKILCLLVGLSIVLSSFSIVFAEKDEQLENAILIAKEILQISDEEFVIDDFRSSNNGYELSWKSKNEDNNKRINATVKDNEIISFYKTVEGNYSHISITDMTLDDAKMLADEFASKACPTAFEVSKYIDSDFYRYDGGVFIITYQRYQNNIPVENQTINVSVSAKEKNVISLDTSFDKTLVFEDIEGIIAFEEAKKSFEENFGYQLKYIKKNNKDDKNTSAYLAYVPKSNFYNQYIDAKTGKVFKTDYLSLNDKLSDSASNNLASGTKQEAAMDALTSLSKEEKLLAEEVANLPSKDEIISKVKSIEELKIDDEYKAEQFSIYKLSNGKFFVNLEFAKNMSEKDEQPYYCYKNIRYNLTDNKLARYYTNDYKKYYENEQKTNVDANLCKTKAEEFIKKYYAEEKDLVKYIDKGSEYNFNFERVYDDIIVEGEGINISIDSYTGDITSVDYQWNDIVFDSKDNIKSYEEFYQTVITSDNLKPKYITYRTYDEKGNRNDNLSTKLVYILDDYYSNYSAVSLKKVDYSGEEQKVLTYDYTDIDDHYVKPYAQKLSEINIGLEGDKLNPDNMILKRDYLALVAQANDDWYNPLSEDFAKEYIRRGVIEDADKNLDEPVKRIDAVRFMINNLGYKEIAEKHEIYNCPFKDVSQEMKGYGALGAALNIVSDSTDVLNADEFLTRADALIIIYNFLSRE